MWWHLGPAPQGIQDNLPGLKPLTYPHLQRSFSGLPHKAAYAGSGGWDMQIFRECLAPPTIAGDQNPPFLDKINSSVQCPTARTWQAWDSNPGLRVLPHTP